MTFKTSASDCLWMLATVFLLLALSTANTADCSAQSFTGEGDGFSWNDSSNWSLGNVPSSSSQATISSLATNGFSVQVNSPTTVQRVTIESNTFDTSLSVMAELTADNILCAGNSASLNVNSNLNLDSGMQVYNGATLNLNSGSITAQALGIGFDSQNGLPTFNQNGGNFIVEDLSAIGLSIGSQLTVSIGPNDNVTDKIEVLDGANVICDRPLLINPGRDAIRVRRGSTLTINQDLIALGSTSVIGSGLEPTTLILNDAMYLGGTLFIQDAFVDRIGGGQLNVEDFSLFSTRANGMNHFIITEEDTISNRLTAESNVNFPVAVTIEGPHTLQSISQSFSMVNYFQEPGENEGLALTEYTGSADAILNLEFDDDSVAGLDWVLRVDGDKVADLEAMIGDGRIVITGAEFSVEYDANANFTYVQQTSSGRFSRGDVNQDGAISFLDISPFITVVSSGGFQAEADINNDLSVGFLDIGPFIALLSQQ